MLQLWFISNTLLGQFNAKIGGMKLGLNVVVLMFVGTVWFGRSWKIASGSVKVLLFFLAYALFSLGVALNGPCSDLLLKSVLTIPILAFLVLMASQLGRTAGGMDWLSLQKTAQWCLLVAFLAFIVEMLVPAWFPLQAGYRSEGKFSGLFGEPSGVAINLFPCIAVLLAAERKGTRQMGVLALLGLLVFSRSSTLIALILAWVVYRLLVQKKFRQAALLASGIVLVMVIGAAIDYDRFIMPTVERVVGVAAPSETENISSLVYVQGWQDAWFNLQRSHGLGLGLNMMGCGTLPDVWARSLLALGGIELNSEDGSFLFAKIVSEAGVSGIMFYLLAIWWWIQQERKVRRLGQNAIRFALETQLALIFCFIVSSFIRGSGYFEGGLLLWVAAASGASKWRRDFLTQAA